MITAGVEEAVDAVARGERVVLIVAAGDDRCPAQPGRLAVLVGDAGDPRVQAAAAEMERELYFRGA